MMQVSNVDWFVIISKKQNSFFCPIKFCKVLLYPEIKLFVTVSNSGTPSLSGCSVFLQGTSTASVADAVRTPADSPAGILLAFLSHEQLALLASHPEDTQQTIRIELYLVKYKIPKLF